MRSCKRGEYKPKDYQYRGRTLKWGKSLTAEQMKAMDVGEIFLLCRKDGSPYNLALRDSYGQIREGPIENNPLLKGKSIIVKKGTETMDPITPFSREEAKHMNQLQDEDFYNQDRRSEYLFFELWRYVRYLEEEIEKLRNELTG